MMPAQDAEPRGRIVVAVRTVLRVLRAMLALFIVPGLLFGVPALVAVVSLAPAYLSAPHRPSVVGIIWVGGNPTNMAVNEETNRLFVVLPPVLPLDPGAIKVIDLDAQTILAEIAFNNVSRERATTPGSPWRIANEVLGPRNQYVKHGWSAQAGPYQIDPDSDVNDNMVNVLIRNEETGQIEAGLAIWDLFWGNYDRWYSHGWSVDICDRRQHCVQMPALPGAKRVIANERTGRTYVSHEPTGTIWVIQDRPTRQD